MYALYVMCNFFVNSNQKVNSLFNFGFINSGGIENILDVETVGKLCNTNIRLSENGSNELNRIGDYFSLTYQFKLSKDGELLLSISSEGFTIQIIVDWFQYASSSYGL